MTTGEAFGIVKNITHCQRPDDEKGLAIFIVMNAETINSITKKDLLEVIRYLHGLCFEMIDSPEAIKSDECRRTETV